MKLIEQIKADRIVAFKEKQNIKKNILGCLIAESCKESKEPDDTKVLAVIKKFIANAQEIIEVTNIRDYEYFQASQEIDILESYRPEQLTDEKLRIIISDHITENFDKQLTLGDLMKYLKQNYEGQYDGKMASHLLKNIYGLK